jgi:hypothetical protein
MDGVVLLRIEGLVMAVGGGGGGAYVVAAGGDTRFVLYKLVSGRGYSECLPGTLLSPLVFPASSPLGARQGRLSTVEEPDKWTVVLPVL